MSWIARTGGLLLALGALLATPPARAAEPFDEALWAALLSRHTRAVTDTAGTRVDYRALRGSADWRRLLDNIAQARPEDLRESSQRLAFWINVYNVLAIDVVLQHWPLASIKDAGGWLTPVWKIEAGTVGGRRVTLDEVEHEILRPMGEPRIHAAIVCASTSCPSLTREPFTAARLDAQLDRALAAFLAEPRKGLAVDRAAGVVRLSKIFDWFEEDFAAGGGVLAVVAAHAPERERAWLASRRADARIAYLDYDWSLNEVAGAR